MAESVAREIAVVVDEAEATLPVEVLEGLVPLEQLTPAQALARVGILGLQQLERILRQPLDLGDLKQQRLIGDLALGANKLWIRASEAEFKAKREEDALSRLLDAIRADKAKKLTEGD